MAAIDFLERVLIEVRAILVSRQDLFHSQLKEKEAKREYIYSMNYYIDQFNVKFVAGEQTLCFLVGIDCTQTAQIRIAKDVPTDFTFPVKEIPKLDNMHEDNDEYELECVRGHKCELTCKGKEFEILWLHIR